jgi:hypothetical protein
MAGTVSPTVQQYHIHEFAPVFKDCPERAASRVSHHGAAQWREVYNGAA